MLVAIAAAFFICGLGFMLSGCTPPYRKTFDDEAKKRDWTEKQKLAAFAYADRVFWARETQEGSGKYVILYGKMPVSKIREQLDGALKNYNAILDPADPGMRQYLNTFDLRKDLEHDEEVTQTIQTRVRAAELQSRFKQDMGESSVYGDETELAEGYNIRKIFLAKDVAASFPFTSEQIEGAKKDGKLKVIQSATLDFSSKYDHKAPDPNHPDDRNEFVWKSKTQAIKLVEYKIIDVEKPTENNGDYIEGTMLVDGKEEASPCLKIFFPSDGDMAIVLIDDQHRSDVGFVPDILQETASITDVESLIRDGKILDQLFAEKPKQNRQIPTPQVFKIEISHVGQEIDSWEKAPSADGWAIPFKYALGAKGDNYNVRIKFKKPVIDPNNPASVEAAHSDYMDIEYISKEYTSVGDIMSPGPGQVIEYYHPKAPFNKQVMAEVDSYSDTKKVEFVFPDGSEVDGYINPGMSKFIEDKPYAKAYTEGQHRWLIQKSEASPVYDKRKLVSPPKESTGFYSESGAEIAAPNSFDKQNNKK